jgi:membrane-bound lytic murein transglycosylase MltF
MVPAKSLANSTPWSPELLAWHDCGSKLLPKADPNQVKGAMAALALHSVDQSFDFLRFATAVIAAESGFNANAVSPAGATGLFQLTTIGAREAATQCRLPLHGGDDNQAIRDILSDRRNNVKYGTCLLKYYLDSVHGNKTLALVLYNGGYQQLTRLATTGTLTKETAEYVFRVHSYLGRCQ